MDRLSPARIMDVGMGFWPAKTLLSAVELGVFTALGSAAMTGEELRAALDLHARAVPDFFDALVGLRFLERDGDGPGGRYRNTRSSWNIGMIRASASRAMTYRGAGGLRVQGRRLHGGALQSPSVREAHRRCRATWSDERRTGHASGAETHHRCDAKTRSRGPRPRRSQGTARSVSHRSTT